MNKVRWGILSTAKIGVQKVIPAIQQGRYCTVSAIASRSLKRARETADKLGIPTIHDSYEKLLDDPDIDAVYIPLPNHLHVPWGVKALEAGKHVLCEKPIGLSSSEARDLLDAAQKKPDLKVMEGFMYRFHPQWKQAKKLVKDGRIGDLKTVHSFFSYYNDDPDNIRNKPDIGGGGLMDIGCYNISLSRFLFEREPSKIIGDVQFDPRLSIDRLASGILDFESGTATFTCSTQLSPYQGVHIYGTTGRIEIEIPFNAPAGQPTRIWLHAGDLKEKMVFDACDQYTLQGDAFARSILDDTAVPTPLSDAVKNMKVIEAIFNSAKKGTWITNDG